MGHTSVCQKKHRHRFRNCTQMTQAIFPKDPVCVRTTTASFQFLLFNVTLLFLEAMVEKVEILKKKKP